MNFILEAAEPCGCLPPSARTEHEVKPQSSHSPGQASLWLDGQSSFSVSHLLLSLSSVLSLSTTRASQFRVILYLIVQHVLDIESRIFSCHESSSSRGRGPHSSRLGRSESSSARPLSAASIGGPELCSATRMISHYVVLQANWCTSAEQKHIIKLSPSQ